ncbi:MAG: OmpA family protein [Muribaculaceae bacterium]|nr:OmpA family protein [Muribaculaceae bacterium]
MRYLLFSLILIMGGLPLTSKGKWTDPYKNYDETLFMDMDLEQNLTSPEVPEKEQAAISRYMKRVGTSLAKRGYTVDMMRDDDVVLVTIPTDNLFLPNDTLLSPEASGRLKPVTELLTVPDRYKVVYAVHTDNTGSERYNMDLSHKRNNSIYDWLLKQVSEDVIIIPYEMGDTDPIESNTSRKGRAANRRLEIYLVPGPKMITDAHKDLLK